MMPIFYVDELKDNPKGRDAGGRLPRSCHLFTDGNREELDSFAASIGLRKAWAHTSYGYARLKSGAAVEWEFYHYDLAPSLREKATRAGAIVISQFAWIKRKNAEMEAISGDLLNSGKLAPSADDRSGR